MKLLRNPITILLLLTGTSVGAFFYIKNKKSKLPSFPIRTEQPIKQDLVQLVNASGKLKAVTQITVGSLVAGRIVQVLAQDNDLVKKNQILAILDNGIGDSDVKKMSAELAQARANLDYQEKFYKRQKALYQAKQLAQNTFDSVVQTYKTAQAAVKKLEAALEISIKTYNNLFVRAPEDSIVISKMVDLGQMVTAQFQATALYTLAANLQDMEAHIDIDEADIGLVKPGQEASFSVDAFPKMTFAAHVKSIKYLANIVDNVVTYDTVINIKNSDLKLRPGMTVNVDITVAESQNAITVPNKALRINADHLEAAAKLVGISIAKMAKTPQESLWIMPDPSHIIQVEALPGTTDGKYTEITTGITPTDKVVTEVDDVNRENVLLKGFFGKSSGGLGK